MNDILIMMVTIFSMESISSDFSSYESEDKSDKSDDISDYIDKRENNSKDTKIGNIGKIEDLKNYKNLNEYDMKDNDSLDNIKYREKYPKEYTNYYPSSEQNSSISYGKQNPSESYSQKTSDMRYSLQNPHKYRQSITRGKLTATSDNLNEILHHELDDISKDLGNKIANTIGRMRENRIDNKKFKEVIFIKKRITTDGNKKIVNLNVSEKLVPKNERILFDEYKIEPISRDLGTRALLAGLLFLCAGFIFTVSLKFYQRWLSNKYIKMTEDIASNDKNNLKF
ncbi:hypothetical protein DMUE_2159 [Dictyocoela muelleri]|nr:hypothetical protein DMUE_2159 [Dictyocoela muelleri]